MDIRKVKKLIDLVKETGIAELEIQEDKERVRITSGQSQNISASPMAADMAKPALIETPRSEQIAAQSQKIAEVSSQNTIKSPMVGTVFLSTSPGAKPLVEIGQHVKIGDVVCLIEAMKMFNRIESDQEGIVKSRLVENEQPVEFDQPLFIIEP